MHSRENYCQRVLKASIELSFWVLRERSSQLDFPQKVKISSQILPGIRLPKHFPGYSSVNFSDNTDSDKHIKNIYIQKNICLSPSTVIREKEKSDILSFLFRCTGFVLRMFVNKRE